MSVSVVDSLCQESLLIVKCTWMLKFCKYAKSFLFLFGMYFYSVSWREYLSYIVGKNKIFLGKKKNQIMILFRIVGRYKKSSGKVEPLSTNLTLEAQVLYWRLKTNFAMRRYLSRTNCNLWRQKIASPPMGRVKAAGGTFGIIIHVYTHHED